MSVQVTTDTNANVTRRTHVRRRWLLLAHAVWLVCAALALLIFLAGIPLGYARLFGGAAFRFPIDAPAWYIQSMSVALGVVSLAAAMVSLTLAGIVFWKKRADPGALFVSFYLLAHGIILAGPLEALNGFPPLFPGAAVPSEMLIPTTAILALQSVLFILTLLLFYLFPNGHFVPGWTRYAALFLLLMAPLFVYVSTFEWPSTTTPLAWFTFAAYMLILGAAVYAQIYRYRRVASSIERQKTKWVVFGLVLTFFFMGVSQIPYAMVSQIPTGESQPWWVPLSGLIWWITISILPFSLAIAVLGYRLWDIDVIINRTLVYGTLSAGIFVTYILLVSLLGTLLNTNVNLAAAIVTLALTAFLFHPLRTRLQHRIDRVFSGNHDSVNLASDTSSRTDSSTPLSARLAWAIAALSLALVLIGVGAFLFALLYGDIKQAPALHLFFSPIITLTFSLVGALVASRHPHNPIGWIFLAVGFLSALNLDAPIYILLSQAFAAQSALPGVEIAQWMSLWVWIPLMLIPFTFLLLLFPDGHLLSPRWQLVAWAAALGLAGIIFAIAFSPAPIVAPSPEINPFGIPGAAPQLEMLQNVASVLLAVGFFGSVGSLIVRARRSRGVEREQIKWLVYAVLLGILLNVAAGLPYLILPNIPLSYDLSIIASEVALCCIVIAAGIAILRYRLYDIDIIVNRTLLYGALTFGIVALYVLLVTALSALLQTSGNLFISLLATGLVAILFQPLRERVQRAVNRLTYGERDEPYAVITRLGQRLESTLAPAAVLPMIVETVAQALQVPYVAIALSNQAQAQKTEWGQLRIPSSALVTFPLLYQNETLGTLIVAPRTGEEKFSTADRRLLDDLARQAGVAAHSVQLTTDLQRLTAELQRSRERLVAAREEERRRLRRDLHDGLGPTLAALALNASTLRDLIDSDSDSAMQMASELQIEIRAAVTEIRRLVYALRPPTLDELGLVGAIRELANQSMGTRRHSNPGNPLHITVDAPDTIPPLPAAVEVAAYRIAQEALTNVVRHAHAHSCSIRLAPDGTTVSQLKIEICDDGVGLPEERRAGVGLHSMRERAEELGGIFVIESQSGKSTRVIAHLPIARAE